MDDIPVEERLAAFEAELALQMEYAKSLKKQRDDAFAVLQELHDCRRTCPTILRFAVSAKDVLKDASRFDKRGT